MAKTCHPALPELWEQSKAEVERYLAERGNRTVTRKPKERIRPVTVRKEKKEEEPMSLFVQANSSPLEDKAEVEEPENAEVLYQISFSANEEFVKKLDEAKALLVGSTAGALSAEVVLERALDLLLDKKSPKRRNARRKEKREKKVVLEPKEDPSAPKGVTQRMRDQVLERDGYGCTFVAEDGTRCQETRGIEVDHIKPRGRGGEDCLGNLRCLCKNHNLYAAEKVYGKEFMERHYQRG